MKQICLLAVALCVVSCMSGCTTPFKAPMQNEIGQTLAAAATERPAPPAIAPEPEIKIALPPEPRISLSLSNGPARQFTLAPTRRLPLTLCVIVCSHPVPTM